MLFAHNHIEASRLRLARLTETRKFTASGPRSVILAPTSALLQSQVNITTCQDCALVSGRAQHKQTLKSGRSSQDHCRPRVMLCQGAYLSEESSSSMRLLIALLPFVRGHVYAGVCPARQSIYGTRILEYEFSAPSQISVGSLSSQGLSQGG